MMPHMRLTGSNNLTPAVHIAGLVGTLSVR